MLVKLRWSYGRVAVSSVEVPLHRRLSPAPCTGLASTEARVQKGKTCSRSNDLNEQVKWCFGALYSTHIVGPRTQNSYSELQDQLRMSSPD